MLNKPKFMKPSTNKEECTIDITADEIPFSCIVDGNESINAWQIVIYDIITNDIVFDTGKITLKSSFYPVDEKNRNVVFPIDLKEYLGDNTTFVNRAEAYYWTITLWGSNSTVTSYQEVFYANKTPSIKFSYNGNHVDSSAQNPSILRSKDCTFKAELDFGDNENEYKAQLKRYGWRITDSASGQVLVDTITKNQIYGSADNIICIYNGFLNGSNYSVELYIETQNNTKITSSFKISVSYTTTFLSNDFNVEALKNEPAIMLDWSKAVVIAGILKDANDGVVAITDTTFKTNYPVDNQCSIEVPAKYKVVYSDDVSLNFDIDENSYIVFSTQLLSDEATTLFVAEGVGKGGYVVKRELSYGYDSNGGKAFIYKVEGHNGVVASVTHKVSSTPSKYVWYNIFMSPLIVSGDGEYTVELNVYEGNIIDCVYPAEDLYPREEFYPVLGNWDNLKSTYSGTGTEE